MNAATIQEIKKELTTLKQPDVVNLCLRLARFKKENKELLTYLLFHAGDENGFVHLIKEEIDEAFREMNQSHLYYAKKSLRKILRMVNKYARYSSSTETEVELRIHFCSTLKHSAIRFRKDKVLVKLYATQVGKIRKLVGTLHADLQYDYESAVAALE